MGQPCQAHPGQGMPDHRGTGQGGKESHPSKKGQCGCGRNLNDHVSFSTSPRTSLLNKGQELDVSLEDPHVSSRVITVKLDKKCWLGDQIS